MSENTYLYQSDYVTVNVPAALKRALFVAQVAKKTLVIVSADDIFRKTTLAEAIFRRPFIFRRPCPCGNFGGHRQKCSCQTAQIEKTQKKINSVPNAVRFDPEILWRDFVFTSKINDTAKLLLKQIFAESKLDSAGIVNLIEIAAAIQTIEKSKIMRAEHIAEAFSYRA